MNPYSLVALILSVFLFFKGKSILVYFYRWFLLTFYFMPMWFTSDSLLTLTFSTLNQASNVESMGRSNRIV